MSGMVFTEEQLKKAVEEFVEEQLAALPADGPDPEFSDNYQARKRQFITMVRDNGVSVRPKGTSTSRRNRRVLRTIAAVLAILIISFAVVMVASPNAYAAVRNWVVNIYNKIVDYTFDHTEDDHASIICSPARLPDGFETTDVYHSGYYTRKLYKNTETDDYIRFEYRKPTQSQIDSIEKRGHNAETVTAENGVFMYFAAGSPNKLFWYDKDRHLAFYVESNIERDVLLDCFASVNYRLPLYEPEWLPEGYKETYREDLLLETFIMYENEENKMFILSYSDMAETDLITVWKGEGNDSDDIKFEEFQIGNAKARYFYSTENDDTEELVWIDEANNIVFILAGDIQRDMAVSIAQGIRCVETEW